MSTSFNCPDCLHSIFKQHMHNPAVYIFILHMHNCSSNLHCLLIIIVFAFLMYFSHTAFMIALSYLFIYLLVYFLLYIFIFYIACILWSAQGRISLYRDLES